MLEKKLMLYETGGAARTDEFVRIGIPFARGELANPSGLAITGPQGTAQPVQTTILKQWPDASIKWLLLDFAVTVPAAGHANYRLVQGQKPTSEAGSGIRIVPGEDSWLVDTGTTQFYLDTKEFCPFSRIVSGDKDILDPAGANCQLDLNGSGRFSPVIKSIAIEVEGPLRATLRIEGSFASRQKMQPGFICRLHFFANSSRVMLDFTLHNPSPAHHPGGFWDLGDPASLYIRELGITFPFRKDLVKAISCSPKPGTPPFSSEDPSIRHAIYQESSGGKNWQSPLHRSWHGETPFTFSGFKLQIGHELTLYGDRATPVIWCGNNNGHGVAAGMPRFWQEFPKAFEADQNSLKIALFPGCFPELHELQGGEQKTTTVHLDFAASRSSIEWTRAPLTILAVPEVYQGSTVIPDLPVITPEQSTAGDLIDLFVEGPELMLAKREQIDEFGWRNFGEIYADHEAVYHQGEQPFISHYSNQYDICAGMYRKFFATGAPLWGELAGDLARHLLDIDIYHTDHDREEYNNGLFWHTDHYIPAGLATHRSFSREHLQTKNPLFCGGGPGAEHCYTTGLLLHYFKTGNDDYRQAVLKLARWSLSSLNGSQTLLATAKKSLRYGRQLWHAVTGTHQLFPRYPLSRGTGNAITACLDAFEAGGDRWFLEQAETLIHGSIHPADDLATRNLLNAEDAWSYTVLLVAVAKYLDKKGELDEWDERFSYARSCLLSFADWMLQHEYPYLDKPEILEYPNETWPAQDLRKSVILFHAARYTASEKQEAFLAKACFLYESARDQLKRHPTSSLTRPVALMLQNGWIGTRLFEPVAALTVSAQPDRHSFGRPTPTLDLLHVIQRIAAELWFALRTFSLKRELNWLTLRLQNIRYSP